MEKSAPTSLLGTLLAGVSRSAPPLLASGGGGGTSPSGGGGGGSSLTSALTSLTVTSGGANNGGADFSNGGDGSVVLSYEAPMASPAPEPSQVATLALTALGLGGLMLRARRRNKAA